MSEDPKDRKDQQQEPDIDIDDLDVTEREGEDVAGGFVAPLSIAQSPASTS